MRRSVLQKQSSSIPHQQRRSTRPFFADDGGFTTAGMAIALLLTLALIFTTTQVYRIHSVSADVQNIADVSALAAENQVASYYLVAHVCDAVVLSLSLAGVLATAAGVVATCVPSAQSLGAQLISTGQKIGEARTRFARGAAEGLNRLQYLLPYLSAAQAARVAYANSSETHHYLALAILLPTSGQRLTAGNMQEADALSEQAQSQQEKIAQAARDAEQAAKQADEHKHIAFEADCGAHPSACMYERAASLASLSGSENPLYRSEDTWSFAVALKRAQSYYPRRLAQESPRGSSVEERGSSVLRQHFYAFACDQIAQGYVRDTDTSFDAYFPILPRNTSEMRQTDLYTQSVYPVTVDAEGVAVMHAWAGCPLVQELGSAGNGSLQQCEDEAMPVCPHCEFSASRVGKIAAATTSTKTGFEYYYRIIAEQAQAYAKARKNYEEASRNVRQPVEGLMDKVKKALAEAASSRIAVHPPGEVGAIALVVDTRGVSAAHLVPTSFVADGGSLGTRVALSAATLAHDVPDASSNELSMVFDGLRQRVGSLAALPQIMASAWGHLLYAYQEGQQSLERAVESMLNAIPLVGRSGLGRWAANKLRDALNAAGLQPVEIAAFKPVLVNSFHVAAASSNPIAQGILDAKQTYTQAIGTGTGNPFAVLVGAAGGQLQGALDGLDEGIVIARISVVGADGPGIDIRIPLPPAVREGAQGLVGSATEALQNLVSRGGGLASWE